MTKSQQVKNCIHTTHPLCRILLTLFIGLTGCVSPIAMHRAVMQYDRTVSRVETELLLLNIARSRLHQPIHFTVVSSIAATFDFRTNSGITGVFTDNPGADSLTLTMGTSASENPTISIIPVQGEEFTKRLLTPMDETKFEFLVHQGIDPAIILRLMARGILIDGYGENTFLLNLPHRGEEYKEFRRRVLHLSSLNLTRNLHVGTIQIKNNTDRTIGRVVVTNYETAKLSPEERQAMYDEAQQFPGNFILVDIRPGYPGGEYPLHGKIKLRSFKAVLGFLGQGISEEPEFHVDKDPRTGPVLANPHRTLAIRESADRPADAVFAIEEQGHWYSVEHKPEGNEHFSRWNYEAFDVLYQLFQMTVTDVTKTPTPAITIAK